MIRWFNRKHRRQQNKPWRQIKINKIENIIENSSKKADNKKHGPHTENTKDNNK